MTQADLDALDAAIAENPAGVVAMTFTDGQTVSFESIDELKKRRAFIADQIARAAGTVTHYKLAVTKKGT